MKEKADLAASVAARLLNRAKETGDEHQSLLTNYCLKRFLYRLGASDRRDRFILKGAMLLRVWSDQPYRATGDLDLLRGGDGTPDAILDARRAIATTPVAADDCATATTPALSPPSVTTRTQRTSFFPGARTLAAAIRLRLAPSARPIGPSSDRSHPSDLGVDHPAHLRASPSVQMYALRIRRR